MREEDRREVERRTAPADFKKRLLFGREDVGDDSDNSNDSVGVMAKRGRCVVLPGEIIRLT